MSHTIRTLCLAAVAVATFSAAEAHHRPDHTLPPDCRPYCFNRTTLNPAQTVQPRMRAIDMSKPAKPSAPRGRR